MDLFSMKWLSSKQKLIDTGQGELRMKLKTNNDIFLWSPGYKTPKRLLLLLLNQKNDDSDSGGISIWPDFVIKGHRMQRCPPYRIFCNKMINLLYSFILGSTVEWSIATVLISWLHYTSYAYLYKSIWPNNWPNSCSCKLSCFRNASEMNGAWENAQYINYCVLNLKYNYTKLGSHFQSYEHLPRGRREHTTG